MQTGALAAVSTRRSKRPHAVAPVPNAAEIPHRPLFRYAVPGNEPGKQPKCAVPRMTGQHPGRPDRPAPCAVPGNKPAKQPKCAALRMTGQHPGRPNRPAPHAAPKSCAEDPFSERCTACKPAHWRRSARGVPKGRMLWRRYQTPPKFRTGRRFGAPRLETSRANSQSAPRLE